jgi:hypothetical protein
MLIQLRRRYSPFFLIGCIIGSSMGAVEGKVIIQFDPPQAPPAATTQQTIQTYLRDHQAELSLSPDLSNLVLERKQSSLLGDHYRFTYVSGAQPAAPIAGSALILSIHPNGIVYRVFASAPATTRVMRLEKSSPITPQQAYDIAWKDLKVHGSLLDSPQNEIEYLSVRGALHKVYKITLGVSAPFGYWRYWIDVQTHQILKREETRLTRHPKQDLIPQIQLYKGPIYNREQAFSEYRLRHLKLAAAGMPTEGSALVFDPDPRTALHDDTLRNDSPKEDFLQAYVERTLRDISFDGTLYSLKGPWIQIVDFEPPYTPPSTSLDGHWNYQRDNNGFNDVMTYFHIDQSQRYIQSLGFTGDKAIQGGPIEVDSDGVDSADNSHFIPSSNRIAFGHGCVPDNEDADVILHEYAHSLQHSMDPQWEGGDTGAMGEGFGDYWAVVYSLSTATGRDFERFQVFNWDAPGCWPGRRVDKVQLRYDPTHQYDAHTPVHEGISDELWSTPLVQSFVELQEKGYNPDDINRLVLESHFGIGPNSTMRDMAGIIVHTARNMYKDSTYGDVFEKHFVLHGIL